MILILADSSDPWARAIYRELCGRGQEVCLASPANLLNEVPLNFSVTSESILHDGTVKIKGTAVRLSDLTGVFCRMPYPLPLALEDLTPQDQDYVKKETAAAWFALLNALPCRVVNRPIPGGLPTLVSGRPPLIAVATRLGLSLQPSRCTTDVEDALQQFRTWGNRAYVKPLGQSEPGMLLRGEEGESRIREWMSSAALSLQRVPGGQPMCVYVVGGTVAATVITSGTSSVGSTSNEVVASQAIARCAEFACAMGLDYAECLIVLQSDGEVSCLDVSGSPNFWRCPLEVQRHVTAELATYLSEERSLSIHDSFAGADSRSHTR
jgi:hypothetical protein